MAFLGLETLAQKGVFVLYASVWIGFSMLNQHVKSAGIEFNSTTAVLAQCLLKILLSVGLYVRHDGTFRDLLRQFAEHRRVFLLYAIPAALYAAYDVLSYVCLARLDPPTYLLLLNGRVVAIGLIRQGVFGERLTRRKWAGLAAVTAACSVKMAGDNARAAVARDAANSVPPYVYGLVIVQILASQAANVYNELLLKKRSRAPLHLQNLFLYVNSVVPLVLMSATGITGQSLGEAVRREHLLEILHPAVFAMVLLMSLGGVVTGAFLKVVDSVRKAIANALLDLVATPAIWALLFRGRITPQMVMAAAMGNWGIYLYSSAPSKRTTATATPGDVDGDDDEVDVERQALVDAALKEEAEDSDCTEDTVSCSSE